MSAPTHVPGSVPSGQSAPFVVGSSTDHSADIVIVASMGITLILLCLVVRIYIRFNFRGPWLRDDTALALATVTAVAQSSIMCASVHRGWGKVIGSIDPLDLVGAEKLIYAADLLYIVTLALVKYSLALLFIRLTPQESHIRCAKCIACFGGISAVASLGAISIRCHIRTPWIDITAEQCSSMIVRWQVVTAFNIISEVALFGMSILLVLGIRMSLAQKSVVIAAFGLRLPTIIFCVLRIHYLFPAFFTTDPTFDGILFATWTQVEIAYSVMAATIPCLKPFMTTISTNWGAQPKIEFTDTSPSDSYGLRNLSGRSFEATSDGSKQIARQTTEIGKETEDEEAVRIPYEPVQGTARNHQTLRGDSFSHIATVVHGFRPGDDGGSTRSNESQQMIIRKEMIYSVEHG